MKLRREDAKIMVWREVAFWKTTQPFKRRNKDVKTMMMMICFVTPMILEL
jgi:hypothetical protein